MTEALTHDSLSDDGIAHGFFTRNGGVSTGLYSSLNCGVGSKDNPDSVIENRARVANTFGVQPENLLTLHQIHSDKCIVVDEPYDAVNNRPQADAFATDKPGLMIGVLTADCGPVLFSGKSKDGKPIIGAAHAGWGGALKGVMENTIASMEKLGLDKSTLKAVLGPCIGPKTYEVSDSFRDPFILQDMKNARFFVPAERPGHLMFDLPAYCQRRLFLAGVPNIQIMERDTCAEADMFFSYRRSTHRSEADYGRQVSAILIKP
jgi:YfiH family protein